MKARRLRNRTGVFGDVDDLDLGHVDGWEHYHTWDFVEHVRQENIGLSLPSSADLSPDK